MKKLMSREEWAVKLITALYQEKYLQTIFNAEKEKNRKKGWILKNGSWAPWFFNMRPSGSSPDLFHDICIAMAEMIADYNIDQLIGVEMAGVPFVGGVSIALWIHCHKKQPIGYTRPLPKKVRTPKEAMSLLQDMAKDVENYGQKEFVEARLSPAMDIAILDDMANDLGSKIIARQTVFYQATQNNIGVFCNKIFYLLNRNKGNREKGLDFANEKEKGLYPTALDVNYIIEFDDCLPELKKVMKPEEYQLIVDFQKDKDHFQDEDVQKEALAMVV